MKSARSESPEAYSAQRRLSLVTQAGPELTSFARPAKKYAPATTIAAVRSGQPYSRDGSSGRAWPIRFASSDQVVGGPGREQRNEAEEQDQVVVHDLPGARQHAVQEDSARQGEW